MSSPSLMIASCERRETSIVANAVVADWLICPCVSNGLITETPSSVATSAKSADIFALTSSVAMPDGEVKTICPVKPARSELLALSSVCTSFDSLEGSSNSVAKLVPTEFDIAPRATSRMTQKPTINRRRRTLKRASFINIINGFLRS